MKEAGIEALLQRKTRDDDVATRLLRNFDFVQILNVTLEAEFVRFVLDTVWEGA